MSDLRQRVTALMHALRGYAWERCSEAEAQQDSNPERGFFHAGQANGLATAADSLAEALGATDATEKAASD